ncbi:MAG TPA: peptide chain release factor N(5)-glutamine methyltransferase [Phycisphaerales bacterium]|nr:peptide chain release factor N(5)-glutamine methyltransferase [Phycisphaerales bacterium]
MATDHPVSAQTWTTRRLLAWMGEAFTKAGIESPRLCAEMLVLHVLGCDRLRLYTDPDRPASPLERQALRDLVARALRHEPVQYLTGEAWFFGLPFRVDRHVLVPRPATETIVEHVLQHARATPGFGGAEGDGTLIIDLCTGSGCVAVALALRLPHARVVATDVSGEAVAVARENAVRHGVADRIDFFVGDLFAPLAEHPVAGTKGRAHYLVANPPYIPDDEWGDVPANVKDYEPEIALRGGEDGLRFVRPILERGGAHLRPGGLIAVEIAESRAEAALAIARGVPELEEARVVDDFEGRPRVVIAKRRD